MEIQITITNAIGDEKIGVQEAVAFALQNKGSLKILTQGMEKSKRKTLSEYSDAFQKIQSYVDNKKKENYEMTDTYLQQYHQFLKKEKITEQKYSDMMNPSVYFLNVEKETDTDVSMMLDNFASDLAVHCVNKMFQTN